MEGSDCKLLDSGQAVQASYTTDAYGNSVSSSGSAPNPFKWNGGSEYYSGAESGLQKVGARYYEPATGRWLTQDTLLIAGSPVDSQAVNRYLYCGGNPVERVDPTGRDWNLGTDGGAGDDDVGEATLRAKGVTIYGFYWQHLDFRFAGFSKDGGAISFAVIETTVHITVTIDANHPNAMGLPTVSVNMWTTTDVLGIIDIRGLGSPGGTA